MISDEECLLCTLENLISMIDIDQVIGESQSSLVESFSNVTFFERILSLLTHSSPKITSTTFKVLENIVPALKLRHTVEYLLIQKLLHFFVNLITKSPINPDDQMIKQSNSIIDYTKSICMFFFPF